VLILFPLELIDQTTRERSSKRGRPTNFLSSRASIAQATLALLRDMVGRSSDSLIA